MKQRTKKLTTYAMICTLAYLVMVLIRIPLVPVLPFLNYDPKDVILIIGGFIDSAFFNYSEEIFAFFREHKKAILCIGVVLFMAYLDR